jgi:Tfp pilus assembly protein PilO
MAILAMIAVVVLGGLLLAWPGYRQAAVLDRQTEEIRAKGERSEQQAQQIAHLSDRLEAASQYVDARLKPVPETADIAGLMGVLSLPVDGTSVRDQMFDAGDPKDAVPGSDLPARVTPLTVDLDARFDSVFALLRAAESMDRLVRVASVKIVCDRPHDEDDEAFTRATVVLEAVYEPPETDGKG